MSRYAILILLNVPLILAAMLSALVEYKLGKISRAKLLGQTLIWTTIFVGLASVQPVYEFLFSNQLTATEPLSLFDVVQITGIITILFMANRSRIKIENLEHRMQELHRELSIRMAEDNKKPARKKTS